MTSPNPTVLEAQARVCTGPHQSRPLGKKPGDPRPEPVLDRILQTLRGDIPDDGPVSDIQMGAFFAAMTLRRAYPGNTAWSDAETRAFAHYREALHQHLPPDVHHILHPDHPCAPQTDEETIVLHALNAILRGRHLDYATTRNMCEAILTDRVRGSLKGAALIGQRMNRETYDEVRAYHDAVFPPEKARVVNTASLTHLGLPYNGSTRYFKPTLFVAAIRAALGRPTVLHGVDTLPPKWGVTEEKILTALGGRTTLSLDQAAHCLETIGFAYVSQREFAPRAYAARQVRAHIAKRPAWAATEKAQQLFTCPGPNCIAIGYYHPGYEEPLLRLAEERGFRAALAIKGEEGTAHFSLRLGKPSDTDRKAVNFVQGFRSTNGQRETIALDIDPADYGFQYPENPRPGAVSPETFARLGLSALSGEKGPIRDRLILNAGLLDHLLGFEPNPREALAKAAQAIDSGHALLRLQAYLKLKP